jgi:hypothetical protein
MEKAFYDEVIEAIENRTDYETKIDGLYRMRHRKIGRASKPYLGAPDMRYGLADEMIEKVKPMYVSLLFTEEHLTTFVSVRRQDSGLSMAVEEWFDYNLKNRSNFQKQIFIAIDKHLEGGKTILKVFWNVRRKRLCFYECNPLTIIVPDYTEELQESDWLIHAMPVSEAQYKRNPHFKQDQDFIDRIKGEGGSGMEGYDALKQSKAWKDGLTFSKDNQIIVWECYKRASQDADAGWVIETISPIAGCEEPIRNSFSLPYDHGMLPFFELNAEIIDKGFYSSRGITEITATHEQSLNKTWNSKLQYLDFHGQPTYKQDGSNPLPNAANYRSAPGGVLPPGLDVVVSPPAPIEFDQEMQFTRALAEARTRVPDLSASKHLSGKEGSSGVTATAINAIVGESSQGNDLRARTFRLELSEGYMLAYLTLRQFCKEELSYLKDKEAREVSPEALHDEYLIHPSGSPDSWNKAAQLQRRLALFQILVNSPYINKGELVKWLLEAEESTLITRLFQDPGIAGEQQSEQQAAECILMIFGRSVMINEPDDHKAHLIEIGHFVERRINMREQITPELARLLLDHGAQHTNAMAQQKNPEAAAVTAQLHQVIQILGQIAQSGGPSNVVQMPGAAAPPQLTNGDQGGASDAADADQKTKDLAVKAGNMLVNMAKAGMPVNHAEINKVLAELNLPPLATNPIPAVTAAQPQETPQIGAA